MPTVKQLQDALANDAYGSYAASMKPLRDAAARSVTPAMREASFAALTKPLHDASARMIRTAMKDMTAGSIAGAMRPYRNVGLGMPPMPVSPMTLLLVETRRTARWIRWTFWAVLAGIAVSVALVLLHP